MIRGRTRFKPRSVSHSRQASLRPVFCTARGLVLGSLASADRDSVEKPQEPGWGQREAEVLVERLTLSNTGRPAHAGLFFSGRLQGLRGANEGLQAWDSSYPEDDREWRGRFSPGWRGSLCWKMSKLGPTWAVSLLAKVHPMPARR